MKIATWNVNSLKVRLPHLLDWLAARQPDVVCLQETKLEDGKFPCDEIIAAGYQVVFAGQKTYNGVAILSKQPLLDVAAGMAGYDDLQQRVLAATINGTRVICVYVPNGQSVDSDKYQYKLAWLNALTGLLGNELARYPKLIVLGDYNIAPDDRDVHDPAAWVGSPRGGGGGSDNLHVFLRREVMIWFIHDQPGANATLVMRHKLLVKPHHCLLREAARPWPRGRT